jgi:hypothetical protein
MTIFLYLIITLQCSRHSTLGKNTKQHLFYCWYPEEVHVANMLRGARGCSGSQKVGARKIARCHFQVPVLKVRSQFRSQLKYLQGANFFKPKQWMIACTTTSFMFSFTYKWSGFVCTNVNVCIVLLFFISISSSKTKRFI